jgi:Holliday junction resolvasome RuvABC endonuclease subunit
MVGQVGVWGGHGFLRLAPIIGIVALKGAQRLVPSHDYDAEVVDLGATGMGHDGMAQVIEPVIGEAGVPISPLKGR